MPKLPPKVSSLSNLLLDYILLHKVDFKLVSGGLAHQKEQAQQVLQDTTGQIILSVSEDMDLQQLNG